MYDNVLKQPPYLTCNVLQYIWYRNWWSVECEVGEVCRWTVGLHYTAEHCTALQCVDGPSGCGVLFMSLLSDGNDAPVGLTLLQACITVNSSAVQCGEVQCSAVQCRDNFGSFHSAVAARRRCRWLPLNASSQEDIYTGGSLWWLPVNAPSEEDTYTRLVLIFWLANQT
jgi:hypothetical protein